jgi:hypothetical protein
MIIIALGALLLAHPTSADTFTDEATGLKIEFADRWELDTAGGALVATAPDKLASIVVITMRNVKEAEEALQKLDHDDVMGSQIKTVRPDDKVIEKKINGLPAKIFTGRANISNVKMPFVAAVVQRDGGKAFVVFAFPTNNAHVKRIEKSIESIREPKSGQ